MNDSKNREQKLRRALKKVGYEMSNKEQVQRLREIYKPGTVLEVTVTMEDPYHPLPAGLHGKCLGVDDAGQLMMAWSDGSTLSLIPGVDGF